MKSKISDVLPLSPLQEGLLFQTLLDDRGEDLYVSQLLVDIEGRLDVKALRAAANALLDRHANLRAGFQHAGLPEPVQVIPRSVAVPWTQVDLSALDPVAREAELASRHAADRATRFDLATPPLLRFAVYRLAPGRFRLAMTKHHLLLDGWSMPILVRELFTLYQGGDLPPVTPYRDYLAWIAAQDASAAEDAWRRAMARLDEPTLLAPADLDPAPARPRTLIRVVPTELAAALHRRGRERGLTMSTLTQGAWGLLCGALTGRSDVVFGATVSGRPPEIPGIESMVGLFINTLPVRVSWDWAEPLAVMLERLQVAQSDLMPYQHTHLAEVQRLAGHQKLFDTVTVFQNYPVDSDDDTLTVAGLRVSGVPTTDGTHYPLSFAAGTAGPDLQLRLSYRADVFGDAQIESTMDRLVRLLSAIAANPDRAVGRVDPLSSVERRRVLGEWNASAAEVAPATIPRLFEKHVRERPDAPALEFGDTVVGYAELDARANRLAHALIERGVGPEDIVAVSAARSVELIVALLAVSKAGAAYLPVDADYPADRIRYMLDDARPVLALVDARADAVIPDVPRLVLGDFSEYPAESPGERALPAHPAYVIYTSGSTGKPKGVVVTHAGVPAMVRTHAGLDVGPDARVLQFASPSFDAAFWEIAMALFSGGTLVMADPEAMLPGEPLTAVLRARRVTHATLPPVVLAATDPAPDLVPSMLVTAGEACSPDLVARWSSDRRMINGYGPTETTVATSVSGPLSPGGVPPIGRPVTNLRCYVLDAALRPVPPGVPGELYVAGDGLARGYLRRPSLTAQRFVANPFEPGARMYRTGDLVRWTPDGELVFVGRADEQVKIRGFRVELGEIESALLSAPGVAQAAVIAREDRPGDRRLVGYVVGAVDPAAARARVADRLPDYMVPAAIVVLDELPVTPNGKLDRKALPAPDLTATGRGPETDVERTLCALFAEVLSVESVGVTQSFFDLGGHSLLATRLVGRIRAALDVDLTVRTLFESPTVESLATRLTTPQDPTRPALTPRVRPTPIPLSDAQRRLWFLNRMGGAAYTMPVALRLTGPLNPTTLRQALSDVVARHESLRTIYPDHNGTPHQLILAAHEVELAHTHLAGTPAPATPADHGSTPVSAHTNGSTPAPPSARNTPATCADPTNTPALAQGDRTTPQPPADTTPHNANPPHPTTPTTSHPNPANPHTPTGTRPAPTGGKPPSSFQNTPDQPCQEGKPHPLWITDETIHNAIKDLANTAFDLTTDPPLRAHLLTIAPDDHVLVLVLHHIAADGWSMAPLARDLAHAYTARAHNNQPQWTDLPVQYADYTLWHRDVLGSEDDPESTIARQLAYWTDRLRGIPDQLSLPTDRPRPAVPSSTGGRVPVAIDKDTQTRLAALAKAANASPFMLLRAAFAALLTRIGAGTDIPIGAPIAGRTDPALDELVGFFVNTLVLRTDTSGDPTFRELVARVADNDLAAYANQDVPFERLVEVLNPPRSLARHPLFQVMLTLQNNAQAALDLPGLTATPYPVPTGSVKFDLSMSLAETPHGIDGILSYRADLFDEDTAARIAAWYARLLAAAVADPDRPITDLPLLDPAEHTAALGDDLPHDVPIVPVPDLIEAQVARTPDAPAVTGDGRTLTYRQLDDRANAVASTLIEHGARPGDIVALALPRGVDLVVALLGVLKSGAAYLPVDPDHPADRLSYVLTDARPALILTTAGIDLPETGVPRLLVEHARDLGLTRSGLRPGHPAYVIYTSGSTGRPKGVVVEHRSVADYLGWTTAAYPSASGAALLHSPVSFDLTVTALYTPLVSGGCVHIAPLAESADTDKALSARPCTFLKATPSHLPLLTELPAAYSPARELLLGGEALLGEAVARWRREHPDADVLNVYGPTEATVNCTQYRIPAGAPLDPGPVPIGKPFAGTRAYVLDARLRPVPTGVPGELYIAGASLARGYLNRPGLTAERFTADPYGPPGARMYRTGDVARRLPSGDLVYLGRADDQVKIRGHRIELGEIEAVLRAAPGVRDAAVTVRDDRLVGYVTGTSDIDAVKADAARSLPDYMLPAAIVALDALPLTGNGKLNRAALPAPDFRAQGRAPRTPLEHTLCGLFGEVLGVDGVGVDDNFFDLGGHSLLTVRLVGLIRDRLGVDPGILALFQAPTVAELAARLHESTPRTGPLIPLRAEGALPPLFCVHPGLGLGWVYSGLLKDLPDQPVYALQARGIDADEPLPASLDEMADDYAALIRQARPDGPYRLLGWSFGGVVAHAIAVRLRAMGAEVDLSMMDAYPHVRRTAHNPESFRDALRDTPFADLDDEAMARVARVAANNARIAADHRPDHYDGDVRYFQAVLGRGPGAPEVSAWEPVVGGHLDVHPIECTHDEMTLPEPLSRVAGLLSAVRTHS
ncbi:amino acid adenylation domain-containing protein [Actinokineospora fastidiosa]|uniref:Carrier domain-containing protein n=1 Tax=Actinokineospora fastidiosa TaxID=1816 RepID=A0A918LE73_9PSEU|nr:non-ribosomal peptide synthetase [Actinokineospora fastidiosa]GGS36121.1 hypothetical protein GCM10010171_33440 [Actinokineospora fastidiosa]